MIAASGVALFATVAAAAPSAIATTTVAESAPSYTAAPVAASAQPSWTESPSTATLARPVSQSLLAGPPAAAPAPPRAVPRKVSTARGSAGVKVIGPTYVGRASWYGPGFQGRRTANGERFDTQQLTAAHKSLPFGTRLRVCRVGRCVIVRVNDRGPYVRGRFLDLSKRAAQIIGVTEAGVSTVTATVVAQATGAKPSTWSKPRT